MENSTTIAVDLSKAHFQVAVSNEPGRVPHCRSHTISTTARTEPGHPTSLLSRGVQIRDVRQPSHPSSPH
jgi:hypothetical protein